MWICAVALSAQTRPVFFFFRKSVGFPPTVNLLIETKVQSPEGLHHET